MPRVTVVIPTHNRADYLRRAIQSVLDQTYQDFEIVVVDDASEDSPETVVSQFSDPRIRCYRHEVKKHVSAARNTGVTHSSGEWVAFLDDDDEWLPTKLEKQIELIDGDSEDLGAAYTGFVQVENDTGRVVGHIQADGEGPALELLRARNFIATASTVMVRRRCFDEVGLFDPAIEFGEEYDMWIRIAGRFKIAGTSELLVRHYVHPASLSRDRGVRVRGLEGQLKKHAAFFSADRSNYSRRYRILGILHSDMLDIENARLAFRTAVRIDPLSVRNYVFLLTSYLFSPTESSRGELFEVDGTERVSHGRSLLRAVGSRVPRLRNVYRRGRAEVRMIRYAVRNGLFSIVRRRRIERRSRIPSQKPSRWSTVLSFQDDASVSHALRRRGILHQEGGHAVYVPPQPGLDEKLGDFVRLYPADAGFKILKNPKGPTEARYVSNLRKSTWAQSAIVGTGHDLIRSVNYLCDVGIGPRLYDVSELDAGGRSLTAFVTEHVDGGPPTESECRAFLSQIRELVQNGDIAIAMLDWDTQMDFRCPGCSGNLLKSERDGSLKYVDFQNFVALRLDEHLEELAAKARENLHFGTEYLFRGGRYLYQRVPGLSAGGRRDTELRWDAITTLLGQAEIELEGRPVLDVGCNAGMMLAQALSEGALWGVGWDRPQVVEYGRRMLAGLGYTRYTMIGANLSADYPMAADIPAHVSGRLTESVVLYLAIRHHIGFVKDLRDIPWKVLVYEGPQLEEGEDLERIIRDLKSVVPCEVVSQIQIDDADSRNRPLVLFRRS